ncbi:MAG TPA: choice-of-anchor L domain-containing protein, partial [Longimicrobiaceae bacterium]|nr:choice-of-anchor L domain-containing protein [Longimicrobiaceae bacterium]
MKRLATFGMLLSLAACQDRAPTTPAGAHRPLASEAEIPERKGETKPEPTGFGIMSAGLTTAALGSPGGPTPDDLAQALVGPGVTIGSVSYVGAGQAAGAFAGGDGIIGFESGVVLGSGSISSVRGPNTLDGVTTVNGTPGDASLSALTGRNTYDAAVLSFTFVPDADRVYVEYVFTSDEYNEWVNSSFDDAFAFYVNGTNCATTPTGARVSINSINAGNPLGSGGSNPSLYRNNDPSDGGGGIDTEMDGLTVVMVCEAPVNPGVPNTMRLAIADASDPAWDSNVFIKAGSFSTTPPPQVNRPPVADAGADRVVECAGHSGTAVALDGSGSHDPDGKPASYEWFEGGSLVATGATPTVTLATGSHVLVLVVTDATGATDDDEVMVEVEDTTAPTLTVSASPGSLWPPDHGYRAVELSAAAADACDHAPADTAVVVSSEADDARGAGDGETVGDVRVTRPDGTVLLSSDAAPAVAFRPGVDRLELRAERCGTAAPRV